MCIRDSGIIVNTSITLGSKTVTDLVDSATVSTIAAGEAISLAIALLKEKWETLQTHSMIG